MKATVIGVTRSHGMSNKKGPLRPYDMASVLMLQDVEIVAKADEQSGTSYNKTGYGFELAEVDLDPSAIGAFSGLKFPCVLDLEIGQRMQFGKLASVCVGIVKA